MAIQARQIAQERDRANREAATAKQVSEFLIGLFNVSDPSEARGNTLTAREILAKGARQVEDSLRDQPDVQARLAATIGAVYTNLGMYAEARPLLQRALDTQRQVLGHDNAETLRSAHHFATLHWHEGNMQQAERLYADVVERRRRILGDEHPDTLRASFDLASTVCDAEAMGRCRATRRAPRWRFSSGSWDRITPDTLMTMGILQNMYYSQGRYAEAEPIAVTMLERRRRVLGSDHPDTLDRHPQSGDHSRPAGSLHRG